MEQTKTIDITYLPANEQTGALLPEQAAAFSRAVNDFFASRDSLLFTGRGLLVLEVPELKARLRLQALFPGDIKSAGIEVYYSFAPHHEEVPSAERIYMAPKEWIENWSK